MITVSTASSYLQARGYNTKESQSTDNLLRQRYTSLPKWLTMGNTNDKCLSCLAWESTSTLIHNGSRNLNISWTQRKEKNYI